MLFPSFLDPDNKQFTFQFHGHNDSYSQGSSAHDGPPRYSIINFAKLGRDLTNNQYDWKSVGSYIDGEIVDVSPEFNKEYEKKGQVGDCQRKECGLNQIKIPDTDDQCCWHCVECGDFKYKGCLFTFCSSNQLFVYNFFPIYVSVSEYECKECPLGHRSERNDTSYICVEIEAVSLFCALIFSWKKKSYIITKASWSLFFSFN